MVLESCDCEEGFGLWHRHVEKTTLRSKLTGREVTGSGVVWVDGAVSDWDFVRQEKYIVLSVDWKAVARALSQFTDLQSEIRYWRRRIEAIKAVGNSERRYG